MKSIKGEEKCQGKNQRNNKYRDSGSCAAYYLKYTNSARPSGIGENKTVLLLCMLTKAVDMKKKK